MKFVLITREEAIVEAARLAFPPSDVLAVFADWAPALDACEGADLLFVDLVATLETPHRIAGYEKFAQAKMSHAVASTVPLVLIAPPADYELDFMSGWPDFVFAHVRRPVSDKTFRRASTWV
jgi:hypothetical protein